jgi:hypothetical protein
MIDQPEEFGETLSRLLFQHLRGTAWDRVQATHAAGVDLNIFADLTEIERSSMVMGWIFGFNAALQRIGDEIDALRALLQD